MLIKKCSRIVSVGEGYIYIYIYIYILCFMVLSIAAMCLTELLVFTVTLNTTFFL